MYKLQRDGILQPTHDESLEKCKTCIFGKMARKPFSHQVSARIPQAPDRYGFYVDVEEYELGDFNEPPNYKATLSDPKFDKWLEAMNTEMQSMKDNQVWVDLPLNGGTVGSKWLFKKKTDMDGNVHTFKDCLVAKGYTQTYSVDYRETFSPVAYIRAIRILLAIASFYDYEIWQMDVKTAFLNGYLSEDIYMVHLEGFVDQKHPNKLCKLQRSIYGLKQASRSSIMYATAVKAILKYLRNTKDMVLVYGAKPKADLKASCYADPSFQTNKDNTKSQTGYVFVLNGGAMDWKSAKKSTNAMSSTKAKYIATAEASMEVVWMRKFINGLGGVVPLNKRPMEKLCDNEPTIAIANDPGILMGARHFQRKYHYIHEVIQEREIVLKKVHTYDNVADPFTKPMPYDKHYEHVMAIGIVPARSLIQRTINEIFRTQKGQSLHWFTVKKIKKTTSYEFDLANKKCKVDVEQFSKDLGICPRVPNEDFVVPLSEESLINFLYELGYKELESRFVDHMHQPWRALATIINKCLSGKTSSNDILRQSRVRIFFGLNTIKDDGVIQRLKFVNKGKDFQEYRRAIPDMMLTDEIKKSEAYQAFIAYSTSLVPPKQTRVIAKPTSVDEYDESDREPANRPTGRRRPFGVASRDTSNVSKKKSLDRTQNLKGIQGSEDDSHQPDDEHVNEGNITWLSSDEEEKVNDDDDD
ncbi:retrotransposon protein, putative, ty1-copia subclass, partial [Tanacetum coccineum]